MKDSELKATLPHIKQNLALVITDSQVFTQISANVALEILRTSFSILFARYKGSLDVLTKGGRTLDTLGSSDNILISETCTRHRQYEDIRTVKLPPVDSKAYGQKSGLYLFQRN